MIHISEKKLLNELFTQLIFNNLSYLTNFG